MGAVDLLARMGKRRHESLLEEKLTPERKRLMNAARGVDRLDMVLGPASAIMYLSGDEKWQQIAAVISATELLTCKVWYARAYFLETKDYLTVAAWTAKEVVMNGWIGLAFGDLFPVYSGGTRRRFEKDYIKEKKYQGLS